MRGRVLALSGVVLGTVLLGACGQHQAPAQAGHRARSGAAPRAASNLRYVAPQFRDPLPGMPPVIGGDVYSQTHAGMLSPAVRTARPLLYVPDSTGSTVTVISQRTRRIVRVLHSGYLSQHVVPAYDLRRLVVNASAANRLTFLDPTTGRARRSVDVTRPYNLYFTPDGRQAVVMVEQHDLIRFANPRTFHRIADVSAPGCQGPNHADFSANGRFFVVTCEFSGELVKVSTLGHRVLGRLKLDPQPTAKGVSPAGLMGMSMPQDIRLSPDGRTFYVADMGTNELRLIDAQTLKQRAVIGMPSHPHGLYPSRDGTHLYISDRGAGKVSVLDFATDRIVDTWVIPGGGSPDMGGVSADGSMLWLSGRYDGVVYGFRTRDGKLVARIHVGGNPHGLCVWPQPGRYSLGHTGNMR